MAAATKKDPVTIAPATGKLGVLMPGMAAVFDQEYIRNIHGPNLKEARSKMDKAEMLMDDIREFQKANNVARMVMIWCGSTEVFHIAADVHQSLKRFEYGLRENDPEIA